jgi:hypothetical protein
LCLFFIFNEIQGLTPAELEKDNILGRSSTILCILARHFLHQFKINIIFNFVIFAATKKGTTTNFFSPHIFVAVFVSRIRDPRSGIRDPGSGMDKNRDPGSGGFRYDISGPQAGYGTNLRVTGRFLYAETSSFKRITLVL